MLMLRRLEITEGREDEAVEQKKRHGAWSKKTA